MIVTVRLFAACADAFGADKANVPVAEPVTVHALRRALEATLSASPALVARSLVAVNAEYAGDDRLIEAEDEVALIPPVAGG